MGNFLTLQNASNDNSTPLTYRTNVAGKNQIIYETKYNNDVNTPFTSSTPDRIVYLQTFVSPKCIQIVYDTQQNTSFSKTRYEINDTTWSSWIDNRGPQGPAGPQGLQGLVGPQGIQGLVGPVGSIGPIGPIGLQGVIGPQGLVGPAGSIGPIGPVGPQGAIGPQGLQGIQGIPGQGLQNLQGLQGTQGLKKIVYEGGRYTSNTNSNGFNFSASSAYNSGWTTYSALRAFNGTATGDYCWHSQANVYAPTSGTYTGTISTTVPNKGEYKGEWLQIQLPYQIVLYAYEICNRVDCCLDRYPKSWIILGSNDQPDSSTIKWTVIHENSITTQPPSAVPNLYNVSNPTPASFSLFRIIFLSNFTGGCCINLSQFNLFTSNNIYINGTNFDNGRTSLTTGSILAQDVFATRELSVQNVGSNANIAGLISFKTNNGDRKSYIGWQDDNNPAYTSLFADKSDGFSTNKNFIVKGETISGGIWLTKDTYKATPDGATSNMSEICNNTTNEKALMFVGNKSGGGFRKIKMWDDVTINGTLSVNNYPSNPAKICINNTCVTEDHLKKLITLLPATTTSTTIQPAKPAPGRLA